MKEEHSHDIRFLAGGGEMGRLIRAKDWSETPVGNPETWPQSLRTTLSIILNSKFPMFLFWGPELVCFYNDAYRPSLGNDGKHPNILGGRAEDYWKEIWNDIKPIIDQVLAGGEASWNEDLLLPIYRNGKMEDVYWTFSYSPVNDESGKAAGVFVTCNETTEKVNTLSRLEESNKQFRNTVRQAPVGITILRGRDFMVEMANDAYLQLVDRKAAEFVGRPLFAALPEVEESVHSLLDNVLDTGIPFHGIEYPVPINRYGKHEISYFNFLYHPLRDDDQNITGIIVTVTDVTESVKAKYFITESERQFRNMVMQSPIPMTIFRGEDFVIEMANTIMFENIWRKKEADVLGQKVLEVFPELNEQKYPEILREVYASGKPHQEKESEAYVQGDDSLRKFYLDYEYLPLREPDGRISGIMVTVNDVTEKVEARQKVESAEERLRLATEATELATWALDLQTLALIHSPRLAEIFGHDPASTVTHPQLRSQIHPDDREIGLAAFNMSFETGMCEYEARIIKPGGDISWISIRGKVFFEEGKPVKIVGTARDITEEKEQQQELLESEQKFRLLADSMPQHIWTADPGGNLNYYNQSVFDYSGLTPEQMNNGGWLQIMHPDDRPENMRLWTESVKNGQDFLFEHRFRRHDGEYRWQFSRAIAQKDSEGNIQMWVGTSTDIQDQKMFVDELAKQVRDRTLELEEKNGELEKMNRELQSFAYISSHDLQEPLRKIQTFSSRILEKELDNLSDDGKDKFRRMQVAAKRMQTLIEDLLAYSRTNSAEKVFETMDLKVIVEEIKDDLREELQQKHASVEASELCHVRVIHFQFRQLLLNLLSNSLKFAKTSEPPRITISSRIGKASEFGLEGIPGETNWCHIRVSDNGIGFEPEYSEKIFEVFQRLHGKNQYNGTGIGLAIVKRIVENHQGIITAKGKPNEGATFDIYIPAN